MTAPVTIRIAAVLDAVSPASRNALLRRLGASSADALAMLDGIRARASALEAADREALTDLLSFDPAFLEIAAGDGIPRAAVEAGLVFVADVDGSGEGLVVPLEVRVALLDDATRTSAPVAALLGSWEYDELVDLGSLHGVEFDDDGDPVSAAVHLAEILTDVERLDGVFDSLPSPAKRLTHWLCEVEEPVPSEKAIQMARRFAELAGDAAGTAERVLIRLGIAHEIAVEGDELLVIPHDVREALRPIIEASLSERCRTCYEGLRDTALPAFRDVFPHGAGGNPLVSARQRVVRAALVGPDPQDSLDRVLLVFRALSAERSVGDLAALHLDVATPDRFAQECLRSWLGSLDDDFTRVLLEPFGGDCVALADWILGEENPDDDASVDAQEWSAFLYDLRANLLFALSVLGPGLWHGVAPLVDWLAAVYRRLLWHAGGFHGLSDEAPRHAFPLPGVEVTGEEEARLYEAVVILLTELLEPIGAVRMDDTGTLFMTNPEALRLFRDGDPGFDTLWTDAESYVGDDIDLWLPIPTSWGPRVNGVAGMLWLDDATLEVEDSVHVHDLLRLTRWANPLFVGGTTRFVFDAASVQRGADLDDPDAFLLWLVLRAGNDLPGPVRALFPLSTSSADGEEPIVDGMRAVRRMLDELEQWGETVPVDVLEGIRSMGAAASGVVLDALASLVEANEWNSPELRHMSVLTGELGVREAVPLLLRTVGHATFEPAEGSAATALARIGEPALEGLLSLLGNPVANVDKRLAAAGALAAMAVLHPTTCETIFVALSQVAAAAEELPEDVPTLLGIFAAETGHPRSEALLHALRDQGLWLEDVMAFDEALWISGFSPSVWGHPVFASPLAHLYPPREEADRLRDEATSEPSDRRRRPR